MKRPEGVVVGVARQAVSKGWRPGWAIALAVIGAVGSFACFGVVSDRVESTGGGASFYVIFAAPIDVVALAAFIMFSLFLLLGGKGKLASGWILGILAGLMTLAFT
jgi:hypothetical protein